MTERYKSQTVKSKVSVSFPHVNCRIISQFENIKSRDKKAKKFSHVRVVVVVVVVVRLEGSTRAH